MLRRAPDSRKTIKLGPRALTATANCKYTKPKMLNNFERRKRYSRAVVIIMYVRKSIALKPVLKAYVHITYQMNYFSHQLSPTVWSLNVSSQNRVDLNNVLYILYTFCRISFRAPHSLLDSRKIGDYWIDSARISDKRLFSINWSWEKNNLDEETKKNYLSTIGVLRKGVDFWSYKEHAIYLQGQLFWIVFETLATNSCPPDELGRQ
jgi:hypothetical protein